MPRPRHCRYVSATPAITYFKPRGIPLRELQEICLEVEELEALRLADVEGLTRSRLRNICACHAIRSGVRWLLPGIRLPWP